jgi:cellulose synthase/poly-beta-1,6-N-acetylglucosamine synthase-like glycosyltransferase
LGESFPPPGSLRGTAAVLDSLAVVLFWAAFGAMCYHWVVFPAVLWFLGRLSPRRFRPEPRSEPFRVSVVMAVYNEEAIIAEKMRNMLATDYPADRMEILIGSDSSTDRTDEIVASFRDPRVRLIHYNQQAGKTVVQNRLLFEAKGDVILCTDADAKLTPQSLRLMVDHFRDPKVAVVNPRYARVNRDGSAAEGLYDRWETKVKELEGRLGAMVGCNAYANMIRREVADPIPDDTNLDDFVLGIRPFRRGYDVVTEPRALVVTQTETEKLEFRRKARINRGNLQVLSRFADLLLPKYGIKAWVYFSHKVLRMLVPFLLLIMLVAAAIEASRPFFAVTLGLQLLTVATVPLLLVVKGRWRKLLVPQYYYFINIALLVGCWQFFTVRDAYWSKTPRSPSV